MEISAAYPHLVYQIAFSRIRGLTPVRAATILELFGSEEAFFNASVRELRLRLGSPHRSFDDDSRRRCIEEALAEVEFIETKGVDTYYFSDDRYPALLLQCQDAPLMLYGFGRCALNAAHPIAVVGTRHATRYGISVVDRIVEEIADEVENPVIVSGLAYGIDAAAHRAALRMGIPTVAVVAHGLNTIYPADHRNLAAEICSRGGMIVTDYTSGDVIHRANFLARNRIVAGLCDCTLVIESAEKGGALSTARLASGYNREVMAVPGRINDPYSAGCNALIVSLQARMLRNATDIVEACNWKKRENVRVRQQELFHVNTPDEQSVIDYILADPDATSGDIAVMLGRKLPAVSALLSRMELDGLIVSLPGGRYQLA